MIDYSIFFKQKLAVDENWGKDEHWDLFISAFVPNDRVRSVFSKAAATKKVWLIFPEYSFSRDQLPKEEFFSAVAEDESEFIGSFWDTLPSNASQLRICIDITGFIRPYLIYLLWFLVEKGVTQFEALYSEPDRYRDSEQTTFSSDIIREIRQVSGCEGNHTTDDSNDLLIIGAGYEDHLISHVAESKAKANKVQLLGFPSLRADMYQESVLRIHKAEESMGGKETGEAKSYFAPANDPFITANVLADVVREQERRRPISNLYLSPLSTHAHVLGFALYFLTEKLGSSCSLIFPFEEKYHYTTSVGISRIWKYVVELPLRKNP